MCARPPFELVPVSTAREEAKSAPAAVPMDGFDREPLVNRNATASPSPRVNPYAPYRALSVRTNQLSAQMLGLRSVQSDPAALTQSPETSAASPATATGPEAKPDRASSMAPEFLAESSSLPPETSARVPSMSATSEGCSPSQAAGCGTSHGFGSSSRSGRIGSGCGCGSSRGDGVSNSAGVAAASPEEGAGNSCARGNSCCGGSCESKSRQGPVGTSSHGCTPISEQGSTGSGTGTGQVGVQGVQGLAGHLPGLSRATTAIVSPAGGPQRIRPSVARVTARRVVKRKAMEEDALPISGTTPGAIASAAGGATGAGNAAGSGAGSRVPFVKPTFGDLEDLWRKDSEAKSYCSFVCSAPAMCRSGQEGVAGPTPEIPGMIVAESSRRKRMRTAAQENSMALLV